MKKFRVISDLHIDVNENVPITLLDDGIFTVICGDTSGDPCLTTKWIRENVKSGGVFVSGNHLPYCNHKCVFDATSYTYNPPIKLMSELRNELAENFPVDNDVTYLDAETSVFKKEIDGLLFIGTTMYTDMQISHEVWNKTGDPIINAMCSESNMNDYAFGYVKKSYPLGTDNQPSYDRMRAFDYKKWFDHAFQLIDSALVENEKLENPLPVILVTHHPLIKDFCMHSYYVDDCSCIWRQRQFNWASYASDKELWLKSHPSIKCYCCGHVHSPDKEYRSFKVKRSDGSEILVVNNSRGYVNDCADYTFNANRFVNTETWDLEEIMEPLEEREEKELRNRESLKRLMAFM